MTKNILPYFASLFLFVLSHGTAPAFGQESHADSLHTRRKPLLVLVSLNGGYSQTLTTLPPNVGDYSNGGITGLVRIMLTRSRIIALGMETGIIPVSSINVHSLGDVDIDASLTAIPVLLVIGASTTGFDFSIGFGYYNYRSKSTLFGTTVTSKEWDMGMSAAIGYTHRVEDRISLGGEVRFGTIFDREKSSLSVSFYCRLTAFEW